MGTARSRTCRITTEFARDPNAVITSAGSSTVLFAGNDGDAVAVDGLARLFSNLTARPN